MCHYSLSYLHQDLIVALLWINYSLWHQKILDLYLDHDWILIVLLWFGKFHWQSYGCINYYACNSYYYSFNWIGNQLIFNYYFHNKYYDDQYDLLILGIAKNIILQINWLVVIGFIQYVSIHTGIPHLLGLYDQKSKSWRYIIWGKENYIQF